MKTLVLYATKHGATQKISEMIADRIPGAVTCNLGKDSVPPLTDFDCVVLGSPLMAGQVRKEVKAYVQKNSPALQKMRLGLFISGLQAKDEKQYLESNFPPELLSAAKAKRFLGGVYDPAQCGFLERKVIKVIAKLSDYTSTIEPNHIDEFVKELVQ